MSPAVRKSVRRQGWIVSAAARAMCFPKYVNSANALMLGQTFVFAVFICNTYSSSLVAGCIARGLLE